ncbi:unnamed protein product [Bursaphelenchus xylophilus]|nr:unnamed protein product [Bursaphelenchus xylophilus]CAG9106360.1 unnamed protein product [Bursaphelenchus xylophilus]
MYSHPDFTANKMLQEFDFGGIGCWHERMYNRQHFRRHWKMNLDTYRKVPHVKYHNMVQNGTLDPDNFNCTVFKE